ncbi:hypothetical protein ABZ773_05930 [Streptomyces sp. NPDC047804]|uniref:hypothetical protein n=1 Tax=Streptomyces sp. NPDC047804 TaxID=3156663 RepID=UPI0033CDE4D8
MSVIDCETETGLDAARDRCGRTVHAGAAAAALARRDQAAVEAYAKHLAPYADALLGSARRALDELPPARHLAGWRTVLDGLAASTAEIRRALDQPATPGSAAERAQHAALWLHLATWADHGYIASNLADQHQHQRPHHKAPLTGKEQQRWTERAQAAQRRGELELTESWHAADGQPITLACLVEDDESTVVALRGDPGAPGWQAIGHYAHEYEAGKVLPAAVPPGVLCPDKTPVAILLWATASGSSVAFGGLLSALYGLSSALVQPVKGRLMDRHGQSMVCTFPPLCATRFSWWRCPGRAVRRTRSRYGHGRRRRPDDPATGGRTVGPLP